MFSHNKKQKKSGFTLIELLIVISILAVLATVTVLLLNPAQMMAQGRDARRISDLRNIDIAVSLAKNPLYGIVADVTQANIVYISLSDKDGDINDDCSALDEYPDLPSLKSGWQYRCRATEANLRKVNGSGWVPIDFASISVDPLTVLPIDPVNDQNNYYTYGWDSSNEPIVAAKLESQKYLDSHANNAKGDGGNDNYAYETRPITWTWACGDGVTFNYKGSSVIYGTVSHNSECWLDRDLGASAVATAYNDAGAYGDLFQWGRLDDGHQNRASGTTETLSSTDNPGHSNFIKAPNEPRDWRSPQNDNLWQGILGVNNPCLSGWRIPTEAELETERTSWSSNDANGAFASPLKLAASGLREYNDASFSYVGNCGYYWSDSGVAHWSGSGVARNLYTGSGGAGIGSGDPRAQGFSVRCIKD